MSTASVDRVSVTRRIAASAVAIFLILTHAQGHVSIDGSGTLRAARGVDLIQAVGDVFEIEMHHEAMGGDYRIHNLVTKFERNGALEWAPTHVGRTPIGYVYGYVLHQIDEHTTEVTAYYDWADVSSNWRERISFPGDALANLTSSLISLEGLVT